MESHPSPRDAWVKDAERWICQIHGVRQCKIDLDGNGEVTGVHVVAGMEREPRHVVRDVEGILKARLGLNVFYKKIGVVQVVDGELDAPPDDEPPVGAATLIAGRPEPLDAVLLEEAIAPRIQLGGVGLLTTERSIKAEVELRAGLLEARAVYEGASSLGNDLQLVARATVEAVSQLIADPVAMSLSDLRLCDLGGEQVVIAAVEFAEGRRSERLIGACAAGPGRPQAAVFAVLDALNRRVSLMSFKEIGKGGRRLTS